MTSVARVGDAGLVHCSSFVIATGSPNVFVNSRPVARVGDSSSTHLMPVGKKCIPHVAPITAGAATVFVNGRPVARVGSPLAMCTVVVQGSPNVFVGL